MINDNKNRKEELLSVIATISKDKDLLEAFLDDLLTPSEIAGLPKRWEIIRRLSKGESQWSIASNLKIGIATVTRGSRELKKANSGFKRVLKLLSK